MGWMVDNTCPPKKTKPITKMPEPGTRCSVHCGAGGCRAVRPCLVWGPGRTTTHLIHQQPPAVRIPPARKAGPRGRAGAEWCGGYLGSGACCGGEGRRWGSGSKRGTAGGSGSSSGGGRNGRREGKVKGGKEVREPSAP